MSGVTGFRREDLACFADTFARDGGRLEAGEAAKCQASLVGEDDGFRALFDAERSGRVGDSKYYAGLDLIYHGMARTPFDRLALERSILRRLDRSGAEALPFGSKSERIASGHYASELALFICPHGRACNRP